MADGFLGKLFPKKEESKADEKPEGFQPVPKFKKVFSERPDLGMPKFRLKYKGICDLNGLYKVMIRWFREHRFEFHETLYKDKPPELELDWLARRKRTGYVLDQIDINLHAYDVADVDVVINGKKVKRTFVRMIITMNPTTVTDYPNIYGETTWWNLEFTRKLLNFYEKFIIKKDLDVTYQDELYYELYQLQTLAKNYLDMGAKGSAY